MAIEMFVHQQRDQLVQDQVAQLDQGKQLVQIEAKLLVQVVQRDQLRRGLPKRDQLRLDQLRLLARRVLKVQDLHQFLDLVQATPQAAHQEALVELAAQVAEAAVLLDLDK